MNISMTSRRLTIILSILCIFLLIQPTTAWITGYGARQKHNITGSTYWGPNLTNYSIPITIHYGSGVSSGSDVYLNSRSQIDFDDVRFTDLSDNLFDYWIEDKVNSDVAHVWVEIPVISSTTATQFYIYYSNSGTPTNSSGDNTFVFFDHFDNPSTSVNTSKWISGGTGAINVSNSLALLNYTTSWSYINSKIQAAENHSIRFNGSINTGATGGFGSIGWGGGAGGTISQWYASGPGTGGAGNTRELYTYQTGSQYARTLEGSGFFDIDIHRNHTTDDKLYANDVYKNRTATQVLSGSSNASLNSGTTATGYSFTDWIFIRKYNFPEPVHSTYYTEETLLPVSAFSGTPRYGMDTLAVTFTDSSTNSPTSWNWSFGDGAYEENQNPVHTYLNPGVYTVTLNATNVYGSDLETKSGYIEVWSHGTGNALSSDSYQMNTTIEISGSDKNLIGYQLSFNVTRTNETSSGRELKTGSYTQSDYSDLKFFQDGYPCEYWIESRNSTCALVWVKIPFIKQSTDGTTYIFALYGNSTDVYTGNGTSTFLFFDDFESGQLFKEFGGKWYNDTGKSDNWTINTSVVWNGTYAAGGLNWGTQDNPGRSLMRYHLLYNSTLGGPDTDPSSWDYIDIELKNITVESRMRWTSPGSATCYGADMYQSTWDYSAGTSVYSPYYVINNGHIAHHNITYVNYPNSAGTYSINQWHKVKYSSDLTNTNLSAWIDGFYLGSVAPTLGDSTPLNDTFTTFWIGVMAASTYANPDVDTQWTYVDDYFVHQYYFPEPYASGSSSSISAEFSANKTSGSRPLSVNFTDLTYGTPPTSWNWSFGDGNYSTAQNPTHTYVSNGVYNVSLNVTGSGYQDFENKTAYITVSDPTPPVADFTSNVTSGYQYFPVLFTDLSTNSPTSWDWYFPNGGDAHTANPTWTWDYVIGNVITKYNVSLKATNADGSDWENKTYYITSYPLNSSFIANDTTIYKGGAVLFTDLTDNGTQTAWNWSFGDGNYSNVQNPEFTYNITGTYTVILNSSNIYSFGIESKINYITVSDAPIPPIPGDYIETVTYSDLTSYAVTLHGYTNATNDVYFRWGKTSSEYMPMKTSEQNTTGNFSSYVSFPFQSGKTYYYAAYNSSGSRGDIKSFTSSTVTPVPTTTFGDTFLPAFSNSTSNLTQLFDTGFGVYTSIFGSMFYCIIWLAVIGAIWLRTESVRLPLFLYALVSTIMTFNNMFPEPISYFIYATIAIAFAGVVYDIWARPKQ